MKTIATLGLMAICTTTLAFAGTDAKDVKASVAPTEPPSDAGFYVALEAGATFDQTADAKYIQTSTNTNPSFSTAATKYGQNSSSVGGLGGLKFGYYFDSFSVGDEPLRLQYAIEEDIYYLHHSFDSAQTISTGTNVGRMHQTHEDFNNVAFMTNGILRLKTGNFFTPYVGVGVGVEYISNDNVSLTNLNGPTVGQIRNETEDDTVAFAAQGIAGFDLEIVKHWVLFTEYKYLVAVDPELTNNFNFGGRTFFTKEDMGWYGQQVISAGLKYNF